jgi:hypothetical protein
MHLILSKYNGQILLFLEKVVKLYSLFAIYNIYYWLYKFNNRIKGLYMEISFFHSKYGKNLKIEKNLKDIYIYSKSTTMSHMRYIIFLKFSSTLHKTTTP